MDRVCVTGGSSFLSGHIISLLLDQGYAVQTTVRADARGEEVRKLVEDLNPEQADRVGIFVCDLRKESNWKQAMQQCRFVMHVASPFSSIASESEDEIVSMAVDGTLRVLKAALAAGVERVALTSSFGAIAYGQPWRGKVFDERDWTKLQGPGVFPYIKSKTLAEKAAWDFIEREGGSMELSVINPVGIFGPIIGKPSSSTEIISSLLSGKVPMAPRLHFGVVDVRDVAELHLLAMLSEQAAGQRFIANQGSTVSLIGIARILSKVEQNADSLPTREMPNWLVRLLALFNPQLKQIAPQLGIVRESTSAKARELLDWSSRPLEETILDTARSLRNDQ
jgi:dihydroflavonol-4-reductase